MSLVDVLIFEFKIIFIDLTNSQNCITKLIILIIVGIVKIKMISSLNMGMLQSMATSNTKIVASEHIMFTVTPKYMDNLQPNKFVGCLFWEMCDFI